MFEVVARVDMQLLGCYEVVVRPFWIVAKVDACFRCFECFECFIMKTVFQIVRRSVVWLFSMDPYSSMYSQVKEAGLEVFLWSCLVSQPNWCLFILKML